jgi:hypothetical protein
MLTLSWVSTMFLCHMHVCCRVLTTAFSVFCVRRSLHLHVLGEHPTIQSWQHQPQQARCVNNISCQVPTPPDIWQSCLRNVPYQLQWLLSCAVACSYTRLPAPVHSTPACWCRPATQATRFLTIISRTLSSGARHFFAGVCQSVKQHILSCCPAGRHWHAAVGPCL